jgi:hypothetical protein
MRAECPLSAHDCRFAAVRLATHCGYSRLASEIDRVAKPDSTTTLAEGGAPMSDQSLPEPSEEGPLSRLIVGVLLAAGAAYFLAVEDGFLRKWEYAPYVVAILGLVGIGKVISNLLKLYGMKVRKLDDKEAERWSSDAFIGGVFGIIKWGFLAACALGAYNFVTGDEWNAYRSAEKLIISLLVFLGFMLFMVGKQLDDMMKKLNNRP